MNIILDLEDDEEDSESHEYLALNCVSVKDVNPEHLPLLEATAQLLYGMIHARFILTNKGMQMMLEKYNLFTYGFCPNVFCESQRVPVVPLGSDLPRESTVKVLIKGLVPTLLFF